MRTITVCHCGSPRIYRDAAVNVNTADVSTYDAISCSDCSYDGRHYYQIEVADDFDIETDTAKPLEFVIRIGGMPGPCYLTEPGDEDEPTAFIATSDPVLASRFATTDDAQRALVAAVGRHPGNEFAIGAVSLVAG